MVFIFSVLAQRGCGHSRDPFNVRLILPIPSPPDPGGDWVLKTV